MTATDTDATGRARRAAMTPAQRSTRGVLWSVFTAFAFSSSTVVGKSLLDAFGVASLLLWRFAIASVALWLVLLVWRRFGGPDPFAAPWKRLFVIGVLFGCVVASGFIALQWLDASVYIVLVYLYPVFVVLGSSLVGIPPAKGTWIALVLVMVGVVLTVPELFTGVGTVSALGVFLSLLQAVLFAGYMLLSSKVLESVDGVTNAAWTMLGAAALMLPFALVGGLQLPDTGELRWKVLMFAILPTVIAALAMFRAMSFVPAGIVAMIMPLEVVLAIIWSVIFLNEELDAMQAIGAVVVIAGVLVAQWMNRRDVVASPAADVPAEATPHRATGG
jgi:drug/metabolite transporter (DMT)-like permease